MTGNIPIVQAGDGQPSTCRRRIFSAMRTAIKITFQMICSLQEFATRARLYITITIIIIDIINIVDIIVITIIIDSTGVFFRFSFSLLFDVSFGICRCATTSSSCLLNTYYKINIKK